MGCYPSVPSSSRRGASSSYGGRVDHGYRRGSDPYTRGEYSRRAGHRHERNARPIHYDMDLDGYSGGGYGRSSARRPRREASNRGGGGRWEHGDLSSYAGEFYH